MDGNDTGALVEVLDWAIENIGWTLLVVFLGSSIVTALVMRLILGKATMSRITALEEERDNEKEKRITAQAANEARLSILEAQLSVAVRQTPTSSENASEPKEEHDPFEDTKNMWRASPGAGYLASKLIMQAPTLDEVREIYAAFRSAPQREDPARANWAFLYRLEDAGHGTEVYEWAFTLAGEDDEIFSDEDTQGELLRWRKEAQ